MNKMLTGIPGKRHIWAEICPEAWASGQNGHFRLV
jgi:hypothetical protein